MSAEMFLKYGCNPNQKPSKIYIKNGELPITVLMVIRDILIYWTLLMDGNW